MDVLAILLGQGKSSRLVHMLKDTEELALSVSTASYTPSAPGLFLIGARIEPDLEKLDRFLARADQEIDRISIEGPLPEELKKAKAQVVSQYLYEQQDVSGKAGDLASSLALTGDLDFSKRYVEGIRQVTDEDVRNVLFRYFGENRRTVVTLLPKELRGEKPSEGIIEAGELHWSMQPNGFRLITRRVSDLPIVTLNLVLKGGTSYEPRPGLSLFMSRLLTKGTQHQDAFELARSVESVGASWQSYSANNSFGLSISGLAEHLPDLMRVLAEAITDSVFPRAEVDKARRIMLASLDAEEDDVFRVAGRLLRAELFKKSSFRHPPSGTRESIERLKREDLNRFHRRFVIPANMVLSVIGDIDEKYNKYRPTKATLIIVIQASYWPVRRFFLGIQWEGW